MSHICLWTIYSYNDLLAYCGLLIVNDFLVEFSLNTCYIDYTKKGATDRRLTH